MKRHIENLQRLCRKLEARYGQDDDLVLRLNLEIETILANEIIQSSSWHQKRCIQEASTPTTDLQ